jgi:hypothetical protein
MLMGRVVAQRQFGLAQRQAVEVERALVTPFLGKGDGIVRYLLQHGEKNWRVPEKRNRSDSGYAGGVVCSGRLRSGYAAVTFKRNLVRPSIGRVGHGERGSD